MLSGPEPLDRSLENQLRAFRAKLDGPPPPVSGVTLPGFLFRDGKAYEYYVLSSDPHYLAQLREIHRRGLEAGTLLLDRIKADEILQMVRSSWGKGKITRNGLRASLTYTYWAAKEETVSRTHEEEIRWTICGGGGYSTQQYSSPTGRWYAVPLQIQELITASFGSEDLHHPASLYTPRLNQFFSDYINTDGGVVQTDFQPHFTGLPRTIWSRPDNLGGFCVTSPYALLPKNSYRRNVISSDNSGHYSDTYKHYGPHPWLASDIKAVWFDRSVSQRQIEDYLTQKLSKQRCVGHLPLQQEALERAKLEELRRRGLLSKTIDTTTNQVIYDPANPKSPP